MIDRAKYPPLNLAPIAAKVRRVGEQIQIFDAYRQKYVALTPEEWVRQHVAAHLIETCSVPAGRMEMEVSLSYGPTMTKRADIVVRNNTGKIWLLAECKAAEVPVNDKTWHQVLGYSSVLEPKFILVSNGLNHVICETQRINGDFVLRHTFPTYEWD